MTDTTELPADLLDGRLAASHEPEDASAGTQIARVAQHADRGEHQAAAREAAELIEAGVYDVRLVGFYLFGVFLQRGISWLPTLLDRVRKLVAEDLAALRPSRRKLQVVNSATAWLFEHVSGRVQFHVKHRDATWESWRVAIDHALVDAIASGCAKVSLALEAVIDTPLAAAPLARIRRWTNDDLRRALARREVTVERAPAPERVAVAVPDPDLQPCGSTAGPGTGTRPNEPPHDKAAEQTDLPGDNADLSDEQADLPGEPDRWPDGLPDVLADPPGVPIVSRARAGDRLRRGDSQGDAVAVGSPALAALQAKLRGFQGLVARGELAKAAIVASDVRGLLAHFDPVAFFPSMFAGYFKALHEVIDELAPYFDGVDRPSWHALDSYYRADMRAFFDD